jgi:hypothetical protein
MGPGNARSIDFNWDMLHFEEPNLASMGDPFTEDEVRKAINQMPSDKVPGPMASPGPSLRGVGEPLKTTS